MANTGLRDIIRKLAKRPGGMTSADVEGEERHRVSAEAYKMASLGELFSARLGHRTVRYFADEAARDAYLVKHKPKKDAGKRSKKALDAPVQITQVPPARQPGEPVITAQTKITVCPPVQGRLGGQYTSNLDPRYVRL
jgi:hypothetical protein